jgi:hypothetical protein
MTENLTMEIITLAKWKEALNNKWVKYTWTNHINPRQKEFETCRFYASVSKGMISMPKFLIGTKQKFIKIDDKTYRTESEHGQVVYEIKGDTKPCPECNSTEFITKKLRHLECTNPKHYDEGKISMVKFS